MIPLMISAHLLTASYHIIWLAIFCLSSPSTLRKWTATALTVEDSLTLPEAGIAFPVAELYEGGDLGDDGDVPDVRDAPRLKSTPRA